MVHWPEADDGGRLRHLEASRQLICVWASKGRLLFQRAFLIL